MKYFLFFLALFPLISTAQQRVSILLESNINYAPLGMKLIINDESKNLGLYLTTKISEDYFMRDIYNVGARLPISNSDIADFNELVIGGGLIFNVNESFGIYIGSGIMTGNSFISEKHGSGLNKEWIRTSESVNLPMASFGLTMDWQSLKFTIGNETAFTTEETLPGNYINSEPYKRLSSFTFGIGYTF